MSVYDPNRTLARNWLARLSLSFGFGTGPLTNDGQTNTKVAL